MTGGSATDDIGLFGMAYQVQSACYPAGGLVFGVALCGAGALARWAAGLLAVGGVVTIARSMMTDAFYRLLAFPNGIALMGLGYPLWVTSCAQARTEATVDDLPVAIAGAE